MNKLNIEQLFSEPVVNLGNYIQKDFDGIIGLESSLRDKLDCTIQVYDADKAALYDERHYYPEGQRILISKALDFLPQIPKDLI